MDGGVLAGHTDVGAEPPGVLSDVISGDGRTGGIGRSSGKDTHKVVSLIMELTFAPRRRRTREE